MARFVDQSLQSDATRIRRPAAAELPATAWPAGRWHWALPCRWWPDTRTSVRLRQVGESRGRRLQQELPPTKPKRVQPTGPPATTTPLAANIKASLTWAEVAPGCCKGTLKYAIKACSWAGQLWPKSVLTPALDLYITEQYQQDKTCPVAKLK